MLILYYQIPIPFLTERILPKSPDFDVTEKDVADLFWLS
jgi:hypothetical protein